MRSASISAAMLLLVAWLPGALVYRLPYGDRERRAALPAEERLFWQILISLSISLTTVLLLAAAHRYNFTRLLIADVLIAGALAAAPLGAWHLSGKVPGTFPLRLRGARPGLSAAIALALALVAAWRFFPPAEYVIGGKDPGIYINEGISIAQRGALVYDDPVVASVPVFARDLFFPPHHRAGYYGQRFMGFYVQDPDRGAVAGQFPHLLPASIAIAYGIDGLTGARRAGSVWAVLGIIAVYLAGSRLLGRTAAAAAAALLTLNVVEVWFGRYPNAEVVMQTLVFGALLANGRAQDGDRFFAPVAAVLLGLLLFLRFDSVMAVGAIVLANVLSIINGKKLNAVFVAILAAATGIALLYLAGPMRAYAEFPFQFVLNMKRWQHAALLLFALSTTAVILYRDRLPRLTDAIVRWTPTALVAIVWLLAAYAYFLREPVGKTALENAYALRMFAAFYVTAPALAAALMGYAIVTRRLFWKDPAFILTITLFSLFLFYKIRIVPEHFWAARRWLPVILPGTLLLACAAATGALQQSRRRRFVTSAIGLLLIALLAAHYARVSRPIVDHIEYEGLIPQLEQLAGRVGDNDLLIVESRDAGSDAHVFGLPLAYVYARQVLVLNSAVPDKSTFGAFLDWARRRYARVLFLGGGGTDLLSNRWTARAVASQRFQVPEYESSLNAFPRGVRKKEFDFGLYEVLPPSSAAGLWFDLDVGTRDDLHVVRFHAKEEADGRTIRWSQRQSFVAITTVTPGTREVVLTMSSGGRPPGAPPADVEVSLDDRALGTIHVEDGFRPYTLPIPAELAAKLAASGNPARLRLVAPTWRPRRILGTADDRELGVMVDRVQVR
jgi:hypothetical protein